MSERKVLNKYYPPDYDPSKVVRKRKTAEEKARGPAPLEVRIMMPMTIQCLSCGEFIYKGKKFNAKKETVAGEVYMKSIKIYRFMLKCTRCNAMISFKTDPANAGYTVETGAKRNFEPWKHKEAEEKKLALERSAKKEEEKGDLLKKLENQSELMKEQMRVSKQLEEMERANSRINYALQSMENLGDIEAGPSLSDDEERKEENKEAAEAFHAAKQRRQDIMNQQARRRAAEERIKELEEQMDQNNRGEHSSSSASSASSSSSPCPAPSSSSLFSSSTLLEKRKMLEKAGISFNFSNTETKDSPSHKPGTSPLPSSLSQSSAVSSPAPSIETVAPTAAAPPATSSSSLSSLIGAYDSDSD